MSAVERQLLAAVRDLTTAIADLAAGQPRAAYRLPAAAKRMDISESHLARLIKRGVVGVVPHMGAVVLVPHSEIDRVCSSSTVRDGPVGVARPVERPDPQGSLRAGRGSKGAA